MSHFRVLVRRIDGVNPHPKADRLDLVTIGGYTCAVPKGSREAGELVVHVPEAAICPRFVLEHEKLWDEVEDKGKCAGPRGDRIKAVRLRGVLSQGLAWHLEKQEQDGNVTWLVPTADGRRHPVTEGQEVAELLGIVKHQPDVPAELLGMVYDAGIERLPRFDIEDIKMHPDLLVEGEEVEFTEKMHGTQMVLMRLPKHLEDPAHGRFVLSTKGLCALGMALQIVPENATNSYVKAFLELDLGARLDALAAQIPESETTALVVVAELIGVASLQDLGYGADMDVRVFDVGTGLRHAIAYKDRDVVATLAQSVGLNTAPVLYRGPFSQEALDRYTSGKETVSGKGLHIREGVVIRTIPEREDMLYGRVILKSISPDYVTRPNGTEYQ